MTDAPKEQHEARDTDQGAGGQGSPHVPILGDGIGMCKVLQPRLQLRRQWGDHHDCLPRRRLLKLDAVRVQEVAAQVRLRGRPVERVPHHGMFDARQMYPDLVRATRPDAYCQQGEARER
jgi:hypothetical protein